MEIKGLTNREKINLYPKSKMSLSKRSLDLDKALTLIRYGGAFVIEYVPETKRVVVITPVLKPSFALGQISDIRTANERLKAKPVKVESKGITSEQVYPKGSRFE
jgi:hypothetical protein